MGLFTKLHHQVQGSSFTLCGKVGYAMDLKDLFKMIYSRESRLARLFQFLPEAGVQGKLLCKNLLSIYGSGLFVQHNIICIEYGIKS